MNELFKLLLLELFCNDTSVPLKIQIEDNAFYWMSSLSSQNACHKTLLIWSGNKKGTQASLRMDVMD